MLTEPAALGLGRHGCRSCSPSWGASAPGVSDAGLPLAPGLLPHGSRTQHRAWPCGHRLPNHTTSQSSRDRDGPGEPLPGNGGKRCVCGPEREALRWGLHFPRCFPPWERQLGPPSTRRAGHSLVSAPPPLRPRGRPTGHGVRWLSITELAHTAEGSPRQHRAPTPCPFSASSGGAAARPRGWRARLRHSGSFRHVVLWLRQ